MIQKVIFENEMMTRELERTQKNNRTLIEDYIKSGENSQHTRSQVNLFCSMSNDDLTSSYIPQKTQGSMFFPKVGNSALKSSINEDEVSDIFRNTVSSFQGYKREVKAMLRRNTQGGDPITISREVRSVTRYGYNSKDMPSNLMNKKTSEDVPTHTTSIDKEDVPGSDSIFQNASGLQTQRN